MDTEGIPEADLAGEIEMRYLEFGDEIGKGSFGSVYRGEYVGTAVAIKKIMQQEDVEEDLRIYVDREHAMTKFHHPHLVQFIGACKADGFVYLVTEYVPGGDLRSYLKDPKADMPWMLRVHVALDTAKGMAFLHSKGIMHRDLKSKNLLVDQNWKIKLCDFGFARSFARKEKRPYSICGTEDWMAPELILGMDYDEKVDVFSYGIVLAEIISRKKASTDIKREAVDGFTFNAAEFRKIVPADCPESLVALCVACCADEPEDRPDFFEVIRRLQDIVKELTVAPEAAKKPAPEVVAEVPDAKAKEAKEKAVENAPKLVDPSKRPERRLTESIGVKKWVRVPQDSATGSGVARGGLFYGGGGAPRRLVSDDTTVRSPSMGGRRQPGVSTTDVAAMKTVKYEGDPEKLYNAMDAQFGPGNMQGWVLVSYASPAAVTFDSSGTSVPELVAKLKENDIQYALVRLPLPDEAAKSRDILIQWFGPSTPIVQRGRKRSHMEDIKALLQPFHAELQAVNREHITEAVILDKSAPLSGSHVID